VPSTPSSGYLQNTWPRAVRNYKHGDLDNAHRLPVFTGRKRTSGLPKGGVTNGCIPAFTLVLVIDRMHL
ncbi:hypothetical protein BaRGS_00024669, partial [Batillaria attramentaria]